MRSVCCVFLGIISYILPVDLSNYIPALLEDKPPLKHDVLHSLAAIFCHQLRMASGLLKVLMESVDHLPQVIVSLSILSHFCSKAFGG